MPQQQVHLIKPTIKRTLKYVLNKTPFTTQLMVSAEFKAKEKHITSLQTTLRWIYEYVEE